MGSVLTALLTQIASLISGGIGGAIGTITTLINGGTDQLLKFHKEGIAFARDMGMSLNQAQAYTRTLTENTAKLAHQYGVTAEQIIAVQRGISEATNRQLMLNQSQTEGFVALNKLVGEATANKFAEEIMQNMGGQIDTVQNAVSKAYATAAKNGLNAKKVSADIANNLSMMNKLSFRNGVDGLTKMAVQAQKVGLSLNQVEGVAKTFMDFEGAIEHSAQLQMLGGAAGAFGGNPLDMMYEANYDPEALQDRMIKMMSGYAEFDEKTGMAKINGMNMDYIRNIAKALGMDEGEAVKVAKRNSEIKYKEGKLGNLQGYSETEKNAILNKSYVENGRVYINDKNNQKVDITGGNIPPELTEFISKYEGMDELDVAKQQAQELTDIKAKIDGFWESTKAHFAKVFEPYIPKIQEFINEYGKKAMAYVPRIAEGVQTIVTTGIDIIKGVRDFFKSHETLTSILKNGFKFIGDHLAEITIALLGFKGLKALSGLKLGGTSVGSAGAKAAKGVWNLGKSVGSKLFGGFKLGKALKGVAKGGVAGIAGMAGDAATDWAVEKGYVDKGSNTHTALKAGSKALEYGALGATIGSVIPGIGTAVGAGIGGLYGAIDGYLEAQNKSWGSAFESLANKGSDALNKLGEKISSAFEWAGNAIPEYVKKGVDFVKSIPEKIHDFVFGVLDKVDAGVKFIKEKIDTIINGAKKIIDDPIGTVKDVAKGAAKGIWNTAKDFIPHFAEGGHVPGTGTGDTVPAMLTPGEYVVPREDVIKAKPVGNNDFTYKPGRTETSKVGDSTVTVKDFNININGSLRLDGGMNSAKIDINELLRDPQFVSQLKEVITDAISASYHGGRKLNDVPTMRGLLTQSTL